MIAAHIQNRAAYLKAPANYMKLAGWLAIIEMDKNDPNPPHKNQPELLMAREKILKWMSDAGFKMVREHPDLFPSTKWFFVFGRSQRWLALSESLFPHTRGHGSCDDW